MPCSIPGMCSRQADCADHNCPGRGLADESPVDAERAESWVLPTAVTVAVFVFAAFCAVAYLGAPLVFPFN
jgi:hypothetical protein